MTPKHVRIIKKLIEAKGKGVLEIDLLDDFEKRANTRKIKSRANKFLGSQAITVRDGRWYLDKEYWDITPVELRDLLIAYELSKTRLIIFWSMGFAIVAIFLFGFSVGLFIEIDFYYG